MTENRDNTDIRTKYEYLIAGIVVLLLCISAFGIYKVTSYIKTGSQAKEPGVAPVDSADGAVLIEVEISQEADKNGNGEEDKSISDAVEAGEVVIEIVNEHDNIRIFTTTETGKNYYKSREGRLTLYATPAETDEPRPSLVEERSFEVVGFSRDGWAAIDYGGSRYYVKSADIVLTDAPANAADRHVDPENTQGIRFFTPVTSDDFEYVVKRNTRAFSLPDVLSTGNKIDLKAGERVLVVARCGEWYKIIYMNAEYFVLSAVEPREQWIKENPDTEIEDNTGYPPAGSAEAASSVRAASGAAPDTQVPAGTGDQTPADPDKKPSDQSSSDSSTEQEEPIKASGQSSFEKELLDLVNQARADEGLEPLTWSDTLAKCAAERASELPLLTKDQNEQHLRPNGKPWYTVNGYTESTSPLGGENIGCGQSSAQAVFDAWMESTGHRDNILNPEFKTFGAALFRPDSDGYEFDYYWIEEFGY